MAVSTFQAAPPKPSLGCSLLSRRMKRIPLSLSNTISSYKPVLRIRAIDVAQPFDYESRMAQQFHDAQKL